MLRDTAFLAVLIGSYLTLVGIALMRSTDRFQRILRDRDSLDPVISHLAGSVTFVAGLAILLVHHRLNGVLEALVTFTGLVTALKGALLILAPEILFVAPAWSATGLRVGGGVTALIGAAMVAAGVKWGWSHY